MRRLAAFAVVLLLGCDKSPLEQSADELREARALWQEQGITSYQFELRYGCFCPPEVVRPVTITVINGVMTSMVYADSGTAAPPAEKKLNRIVMNAGHMNQYDIMLSLGNAISPAPIISGIRKLPKAPTMIGMTTTKIMIVACMVKSAL